MCSIRKKIIIFFSVGGHSHYFKDFYADLGALPLHMMTATLQNTACVRCMENKRKLSDKIMVETCLITYQRSGVNEGLVAGNKCKTDMKMNSGFYTTD